MIINIQLAASITTSDESLLSTDIRILLLIMGLRLQGVLETHFHFCPLPRRTFLDLSQKLSFILYTSIIRV